jgi:putative thiamine transport system ATP-binding protein
MSLKIDVTCLALRQTSVISDLHIDVPPGVVHTVMGPSGSGKSSLLVAV